MENNSAHQSGAWYSTQNPLLAGLPQYNELPDFRDALAFNPLDKINIHSLNFMERDALLVGEKVPLEPMMQNLRAAMTWYGMLTQGLRARNPILPEARKHYWDVLQAVAMEKALPPFPTTGMSIHVVKGPTGTGKTVTVQRFCQMLPQVINHSQNAAAGWVQLSQLVYLDVMMSHDGSRGGFLQNILMKMDLALGTNYSVDLPKKWKTVEKLAVATIGRLIAHFCGIIFIDEGQLRNLVLSGQAELMQTFLLLLMNSGIPTVFVGNEVAFDWVTYSQDKSRLNINPPEIFSPVGAIDYPGVEDDWNAVSTGIMKYFVLKNPIENWEECRKLLRQYSGGIARLGLTLWCSMQRNLLFSGKESAGPEDLTFAYKSESYDELRPLADGFHFRKVDLLMNFPDVNASFYAKHWGVPLKGEKEAPRQSEQSKPQSPPKDGQTKKKPASGKTKFAQEKARETKRAKERAEKSKTLDEDDIRKQGLVNVNLEGLEKARKAAEQERSDS